MKPFKQYLRFWLSLLDLEEGGKGDTEEADCLRDRMDPVWYELTKNEMKFMDEVAIAIDGGKA